MKRRRRSDEGKTEKAEWQRWGDELNNVGGESVEAQSQRQSARGGVPEALELLRGGLENADCWKESHVEKAVAMNTLWQQTNGGVNIYDCVAMPAEPQIHQVVEAGMVKVG